MPRLTMIGGQEVVRFLEDITT